MCLPTQKYSPVLYFHITKNTVKVNKAEVGHVFQLGAKCTESMNMTYTDKDGSEHRGTACGILLTN